MTERMRKALEFATKAHEGQVRKFTGEPYINHCIRVADRAVLLKKQSGDFVDDEILEDIWVIGVTHDTLEDVEWVTLEIIEKEFGLRVRWGVEALTKKDGEDYLTAILRAKAYTPAKFVKIADNDDNMRDLKEGTLKDKYRLSRYILTH